MRCFATNLKRIRENAGLTQEQLAQSINVTRQAISRWERGHTQPDLETLIILANVLNVCTEELVSGVRNKHYSRFQKKYFICSIVCFSLVLIILLLQIIVRPRIEELVNTSHIGAEAYYLAFKLLLPVAGYVSTGVFIGAFIALFYKLYLNKLWRNTAFVLGLISILPSVLVILDVTVFSIMRLQLMQSLFFVIFPMISGVFLFLGFNREENGSETALGD